MILHSKYTIILYCDAFCDFTFITFIELKGYTPIESFYDFFYDDFTATTLYHFSVSSFF